MTTSNLKIVYVPLTSLHHTEYNPRIINDITKAPVRTSIEMYGVQDPLIVNSAPERKGAIIGGNLRYEVMKGLGFTEAPVIYISTYPISNEKKICA